MDHENIDVNAPAPKRERGVSDGENAPNRNGSDEKKTPGFRFVHEMLASDAGSQPAQGEDGADRAKRKSAVAR